MATRAEPKPLPSSLLHNFAKWAKRSSRALDKKVPLVVEVVWKQHGQEQGNKSGDTALNRNTNSSRCSVPPRLSTVRCFDVSEMAVAVYGQILSHLNHEDDLTFASRAWTKVGQSTRHTLILNVRYEIPFKFTETISTPCSSSRTHKRRG